jgi:cadmium resistance protein CadD (predicted permease)
MANVDIFKAVVAFIGVSFDEFVVLILFFSRIYNEKSSWTAFQVIVGHVMAFAVVVGISLAVGALGGFIIPIELLGLLGVVPLWLGLHDLKKRIPRYFPNCRSMICCGMCDSSNGIANLNNHNRNQYTALSSQSTQPGVYGSIGAGNCEAAVELAPTKRDEEVGRDDNNREIAEQDRSCRDHICNKNVWIVFGSGLSEGSEEVAVFSTLFSALIKKDATHGVTSWKSSILAFTIILLFACLALQLLVAFFVASSCARHMASNSKEEKSGWEIALKLGAPTLLVVLGIAVLEDTICYIIGN